MLINCINISGGLYVIAKLRKLAILRLMLDDGANRNNGGPDINFKGGTQCDSVPPMKQYKHAILAAEQCARKMQ